LVNIMWTNCKILWKYTYSLSEKITKKVLGGYFLPHAVCMHWLTWYVCMYVFTSTSCCDTLTTCVYACTCV